MGPGEAVAGELVSWRMWSRNFWESCVSTTLEDVVQGHPKRFCVPLRRKSLVRSRILDSWIRERPLETTLPSCSLRTGNLFAPCPHIGTDVCKCFLTGNTYATRPVSGKCCALEIRPSWNSCCYFYPWFLILLSRPTWIYLKSEPSSTYQFIWWCLF